MTLLRSLLVRWRHWKGAATRALLRDPYVVLFERAAGPAREGEGNRVR